MKSFNNFENIESLSQKTETLEESFENDNPFADDKETYLDHNKLDKEFENNADILDESDKMNGCPIEGNNGRWSGERGDSDWIPDKQYTPNGQHTNPENKIWSEILSEYEVDKIPFKDGEPDFSEVTKTTVEIDNFTDKRTGKGGNFDQADQKLMQETGMTREELAVYKENHTWHEKSDCKTLVLVPTVIHGNISHNGGVSQYKSEN